MNFFGKRVLFLGAHPDDIELGCGALLHHIVKETDVLCVTLSDNQKNPDLKQVRNEHIRSMKILGVPEEKVVFGTFQTRVFPDSRQEILEYFLKLRKEFQPDLIFTHSKQDVHQDHNTMTDEALRAFRGITVLGFDVVRSSYGFFPNFSRSSNRRGCEQEDRSIGRVRNLPRPILLQQRADPFHYGASRRAGGMSICRRF